VLLLLTGFSRFNLRKLRCARLPIKRNAREQPVERNANKKERHVDTRCCLALSRSRVDFSDNMESFRGLLMPDFDNYSEAVMMQSIRASAVIDGKEPGS
jgi:hypothetical protein